MSDIAILKEMIKQSATVVLEDKKDKKQVILKEPPPANYSVTIDGMPDDDQFIVIKTDTFPAPKTVFIDSKGECKRADFVIIANTNKKKVILCIEMKAGKGEQSEIIQQLLGARCLVAYFRKIGQLFWNQPNFLKDYEYRFVCIKNIKLPKKKTRLDPTPHFFRESGIQILKRDGSYFQFNDLSQCKR